MRDGVRIYQGETPEEITHQCEARIQHLEKMCQDFVPELAAGQTRRAEIKTLQAVLDVIANGRPVAS